MIQPVYRAACRRPLILAVVFALTLGTARIRADEGIDAKDVTAAYLKLTDQEDVEGAYRMAGEQLRLAQTKKESIAGLRKWFEMKGGAAVSRTIVAQRTMSEDEARAAYPQVKVKGNVYAFRYRSKYPKGVFFEDLYVSHDSDDVLRLNGHWPQPAE